MAQVSDTAIDFLGCLLQRDPSKRFSATAALQHAWLRESPLDTHEYMLDGSVVQRLQRFATYGALKQQVLRIITDELTIYSDFGKDALTKVRPVHTSV